MWLLILEAGLALCLLLFMVWWVMFSGRDKGEPRGPTDSRSEDAPPGQRDQR